MPDVYIYDKHLFISERILKDAIKAEINTNDDEIDDVILTDFARFCVIDRVVRVSTNDGDTFSTFLVDGISRVTFSSEHNWIGDVFFGGFNHESYMPYQEDGKSLFNNSQIFLSDQMKQNIIDKKQTYFMLDLAVDELLFMGINLSEQFFSTIFRALKDLRLVDQGKTSGDYSLAEIAEQCASLLPISASKVVSEDTVNKAFKEVLKEPGRNKLNTHLEKLDHSKALALLIAKVVIEHPNPSKYHKANGELNIDALADNMLSIFKDKAPHGFGKTTIKTSIKAALATHYQTIIEDC